MENFSGHGSSRHFSAGLEARLYGRQDACRHDTVNFNNNENYGNI